MAFAVLLTNIAVVLLIYLTPLKNLNMIPPTVTDIDPKAFQANFLENPEEYIFVDVRSEEEYYKEHAEGAINIPLHMMYDARYTLPKTEKEIVLICSKGRASGVAYGYLEHQGFLNLKRIEGGISHWIDEGLPTVKS